MKVLKEVVEHHVEEEEEELSAKVDEAFDADVLVELGTRMKARFEQALASDFRAPLRRNLQQVIAGRTRTVTKRPKAAAARMAKSAATKRTKAKRARPTKRKRAAR